MMPFEMLKMLVPPTIGPFRHPTIVTCWPTVGATPLINVNVYVATLAESCVDVIASWPAFGVASTVHVAFHAATPTPASWICDPTCVFGSGESVVNVAIVTWYVVPVIPLLGVKAKPFADVGAVTVKYQLGLEKFPFGGTPDPMLVTIKLPFGLCPPMSGAP